MTLQTSLGLNSLFKVKTEKCVPCYGLFQIHQTAENHRPAFVLHQWLYKWNNTFEYVSLSHLLLVLWGEYYLPTAPRKGLLISPAIPPSSPPSWPQGVTQGRTPDQIAPTEVPFFVLWSYLGVTTASPHPEQHRVECRQAQERGAQRPAGSGWAGQGAELPQASR